MKYSDMDFKKMSRYCSKGAFIFYVCSQLITRVLGLLVPFLTELLIDSVARQDESVLIEYSLKLTVAVVLHILFMTIAFLVKACYEDAYIVEKKRRYIEKMMQFPLQRLQEKGSGYFLQRFTVDIEACRSFVLDKPVNFYMNILYGAGILVSMFRINVLYACMLLAVFPVLAFLYKYLAKRIKSVATEKEELNESASSLVEEAYSCNYAIRTGNSESWYADRSKPLLIDGFLKSREYNRIEAVYDYFLITGILNLVSILVYTIGGHLVLWGEVSYGMVVSMSLYFSKLWTPLEFYLDYPKQYTKFCVHKKRMEEVLNHTEGQEKGASADAFRDLELQAISYTAGEKVLFDHLSFYVKAGDHIAISGSNGSGKTTLANMIAAINDTYEGTIRYNGIDYRQMNARSIRQHICLIPARPELFSGSIRENILMGHEAEMPATVMNILKQKSLPLDFMLQENGVNVSSGEAKLIQLARGFCRNCDLYVIDEPLNYVDGIYAEMIIQAMEEFFAQKTMIVISHDSRVFRLCSKSYILCNHILLMQ